MVHVRSLVVIVASLSAAAAGQGTKAHYDRAATVGERFEGKVARDRADVRWIDEARGWYQVDAGGGRREFLWFDAATRTREPLFDAATVAAASRADATVDVLGVAGDRVLLAAEGAEPLVFDRSTRTLAAATPDDLAPHATPRRAEHLTSTDGGGETALLVVNRLDAPVELLWVQSDGDERSYGTVDAGSRRSMHTYAGHAWRLRSADGADLGHVRGETGRTLVVVDDAPATRPARETAREDVDPDRRPFVRDHNLFVRDAATGQERALTTDGTAEHYYELCAFDDASPSVGGVSPDGTRLVARRTRAGTPRTLTLVEHAPPDQLQPKLRTRRYDKPGDALDVSKPVLFDLDASRPIALDDALFPNAWSVDRFFWWGDDRFSFVYNERGHRVMRVVSIDADTGAAVATIDERPETFVDYAGGFFLEYLDARGELVWMSERDGWKALYLIDARDGTVKRRLTGDYVVRGVERVDTRQEPGRPRPDRTLDRDEDVPALTEARGPSVLFRANGIHPDQDPYHVHYARVDLDSGTVTTLTDGDGTHEVEFPPGEGGAPGPYFIDRYSRVDLPPVTELRRTDDGALVMTLETADDAALVEAGWPRPERFVAKGRDGATDIWGVIWRPSDFDAARKYPVIEMIYAGPQGAFAPKSFRAVHGGATALAELGFVVVQCDGMGTNWRGKAFHDVAWKDLKDAGFPDRIAWMRAAAKDRPWMDLSRVGIFGGSAGGQNAVRALLDHGDFYKAAFADCGCHDNRMDKVWWNELWMGWPVDDAYVASSNVADARKLQGKLMLSVGLLDDNVDPGSTMQLVQALTDADKDYELLVFPRGGHGAGGSDYGRRRMWDFFVRHLLGVEPRG